MATVMPYKYANESRRYRILHATKWSKGNDIEVKCRLVVIEFTPKLGRGDYALRLQRIDGATHSGGSFDSVEAAYDQLLEEYVKHNRIYKAGNPSHYPGIVK